MHLCVHIYSELPMLDILLENVRLKRLWTIVNSSQICVKKER